MTETDGWLKLYEDTHQNLTYPVVFWAAVPMVVLGIVGILWTLPIPDEFFEISPLLNWGTAFLMASAVYYFIISVSLAIGMLPFILGVAAIQVWLARSGFSPMPVSLGLLVGGIIGLWMGHRNESSLRPVLQDLQLVMIGPAWLLSVLYRRIGIPF
ncbi:MAG: DUF962 domain-containing protein [Woeseiaceae bacterium]|jgi:hypothetical protein|nr:DUF962 domain-containing protein [Woeseiaceae bacterium]